MSKVTPIKQAHDDLSQRPVNVMNDALAQALAIADLLFTLTSADRDGGENIESLCKETLNTSLHGLMLQIEKAMEAGNQLAGEQP